MRPLFRQILEFAKFLREAKKLVSSQGRFIVQSKNISLSERSRLIEPNFNERTKLNEAKKFVDD